MRCLKRHVARDISKLLPRQHDPFFAHGTRRPRDGGTPHGFMQTTRLEGMPGSFSCRSSQRASRRSRSRPVHRHQASAERESAPRQWGLPRTASTPVVLASLRALRVDPALRCPLPASIRPGPKRVRTGVDGPAPCRNAAISPRHPSRVGAVLGIRQVTTTDVVLTTLPSRWRS